MISHLVVTSQIWLSPCNLLVHASSAGVCSYGDLGVLMMVPTLAHSQTLTAMWDSNPPSDAVTSYQICIGTTSLSCNFQSATVAASETSYTFAPSPGVLYRVAVRSVNAAGPRPVLRRSHDLDSRIDAACATRAAK